MEFLEWYEETVQMLELRAFLGILKGAVAALMGLDQHVKY